MTESSLRLVPSQEPLAIIVISSFTATPISPAFTFWANQLSLPIELSFASYGQVFQELQRHGAGVQPAAEAVVVLLRMEDFIPIGRHDGSVVVARDLAATIAAAAHRSPGSTFLLAVCPPSSEVRNDARRQESVDEATQALRQQATAIANIAYVEPDDVIRQYRVSQAEDTYADNLGNIPYTPSYFAALGTAFMRRLYRALAAEPKVLVVDGDNTLWDGILGEDGPAGVRVGLARQELQEFLLEQRRAGRLLCLCSKNDVADVAQALASVPGMRLKLDDFVQLRANWLPKSANVLDLASTLDLALDSFVFIDDSPVECAELRLQCPDVAILQLPSDASRALQTIRHFWPLDSQKVTIEGIQRTDFYRHEQQRRELRQQWKQAPAQFIDSLELEVTIRPARPTDHSRMVELTRRTTQFNLTGERYSGAEIEALPELIERHIVEVQDRFGSYGTVGMMMFFIAGGSSLIVTTLLLSCRALGRGVEHRMLAQLGQIAVTLGLDRVELRFVATPRNLPARQFLDQVAVLHDAPTDASVLYTIAADDAAKLRYIPQFTPAARPAPSKRVSEKAWRGSDARPKAWVDLGRVASELTTADSIRKAISNAVEVGVGFDRDASPDDDRTVSRIWAEILQVPLAHLDNDFRSLGGGSLEIVQLLARIYEEFRIEIPVDVLLDNTFTVRNVVAMIRLLRTSGTGAAEGNIPWVES